MSASNIKVPSQQILLIKIAWAAVENYGIVESAKLLEEKAKTILP
jgi:hypothetical protein